MGIDKELLNFMQWMIGSSIALTIATMIPAVAFAICCWITDKLGL